MSDVRNTPRAKVWIAAVLSMTVFVLVSCELASRVIYVYRDTLLTSALLPSVFTDKLQLDPYEELAEGKGVHWRLKPGYTSSTQELLAAKKVDGKFVSAAQAASGGTMRINADGFRGPALTNEPTRERVLMLGDSVTFGLISMTYPSVVRDVLAGRHPNVEVINGGVEGYDSYNHLIELPRYLRLQPNVVTILLGWNDIYSNDPFGNQIEAYSKLYWVVKQAFRNLQVLFSDSRETAIELYSRKKTHGQANKQLARLASHPPLPLENLRTLVQKLQDSGARVVIMTLPGLFKSAGKYSERALSIGHLPFYTHDPDVLVAMTEVYNISLNVLAASTGVELIDLAEWSRDVLRPRDAFFLDSVHLSENGLGLLGKYVADRLNDILSKQKTECVQCEPYE